MEYLPKGAARCCEVIVRNMLMSSWRWLSKFCRWAVNCCVLFCGFTIHYGFME